MRLSAGTLKWIMCFYPPLLINRIWVKRISADFSQAEVVINKSFLNSNFNRSIFGGTIYSAADPFFALMIWGVFHLRGYKTKVWLKSASIQFLKPAHTSLKLNFSLSPEDMLTAEAELNERGKYIHVFPVEVRNMQGELCALLQTEVYARKIETADHEY